MAIIDFLLIFLGVAVGYNLRHERRTRQENLVLEQVDARLRRELETAKNLNESLLTDLADLKRQVARMEAVRGVGGTRTA